MHSLAQLKRVLIPQSHGPQPAMARTERLLHVQPFTTRCAHITQVHLLQELAEKCMGASLSVNDSLMALCSLVLSQGDQ